jgi:hypothetical protein
MLATYRDTAVLAFRRAAKAWPVAFSLILYVAILAAAAMLVMPLGLIGGLLIGFVAAACVSSYLHLLAQAVNGSRLAWSDLKRGFGARFWDVVSVMFALWILSFVGGFLVQGAGPNGPAMAGVIGLAMAFFFNPVPELIYLGRSRSFALLGDAARFVLANPLAWLLPNLVFAALLLAPSGQLAVGHPGELLVLFAHFFSRGGVLWSVAQAPLWLIPLLLLVLHYAMVFRGLLFLELSSGNPRQRAFRARMNE